MDAERAPLLAFPEEADIWYAPLKGIAEREANCRSPAQKLHDFPPRPDELSEGEQGLLGRMEGSGAFGALERHVRGEMEFMRREGERRTARAEFRCVRQLFPEMR